MSALPGSSVLALSGSSVLGRTKNEMRVAENDERMRLRILESKQRAIGIDVDALDAQVGEQQAKKFADAEDTAAYISGLSGAVAAADEAEYAEALAKIEEAKSLRAMWRYQSDRTNRAEWDINDPDALKKTLPPRTEDDISRVGPSSFQVFPSEFTESEAAIRARAKATLDANAEIIRQRKAAAEAERAAERAEAEAERTLLSTMTLRDADDASADAKSSMSFAMENRRLAAERRARERREAEEARAKEAEHVATLRRHPVWAEDRGQAYGAGGYGDRVRRDHFKGMSREEIAAIRAEQARQREEMEEKRRREKEEDMAAGDIWSALDAADTLAASEMSEEAAKQRQFYLDIKVQQREMRLRKKKEKEDRLSDPGWEDGLLGKFNKTGR